MENEKGGKSPVASKPKPKTTLRSMVLGLMLTVGLQSGPGKVDAGADSDAGSRASSYRSRRQSVASQMSHVSHSSSKRSMRSGKSGRYRRGGKSSRGVDNSDPEIIQVFDDHGKNVTPKPLVSLRPTALHERLLQAPAERFTLESERPSAYSHTGYSLSSVGSFTPDTMDEEGSETDVILGKRGGGTALSKDLPAQHTDSQRQVHLIYTGAPLEQDPENMVSAILMESDTFVVMTIRGYTVNNMYDNFNDVLKRNSRYRELLQMKVGSDNYSSSFAQTLLTLWKCKEVQVSTMCTETKACQVNSWDISDSQDNKEQSERVDPSEAEKKVAAIKKGKTDEGTDNASIAGLLVSAGYLESPTSANLGTRSPKILAQRLSSGNLSSSRRGTMLGNLAGSQRGSMIGNVPFSRKGSTGGSILLSCRESTCGSIADSRKGSTTGSLAPSRRGSTVGNVMASRRASKLGALRLDDILLNRGSQIQRQISGTNQTTDGSLLLGEDTLSTEKHQVDLGAISGLLKALETAERALAQNNFHEKLLLYRNFRSSELNYMENSNSTNSVRNDAPKLTEISISSYLTDAIASAPGERLEWLWDFQCDLTKDRSASCLVWNKVSKDLITVGYGQIESGSEKDGLIAFWSLKNPSYPHSAIRTKSGITALDFSLSNANLLAVGFYSGNVAIYDVRNPKDTEPAVQSGLSSGKHNDPVWKVEWIDSTSEHGESIVSISTDGRVTMWSLKKELEHVNLMILKRVTSHSKVTQPQPFISHHARGLCFDFSSRDTSIYLVGTEEGHIHKCSRSYNEQYLQTYLGHSGPVFQVRWSPFLPNLFLSCSSDWSVCLWREEQDTALLVFQSAMDSVGDVRWSLSNACVFGTVSDDGHLEIWDLAVSAVKPVIIHKTNKKLSCLLFSEESPVVVSAGNDGAVDTFRMVGFEPEEDEIIEVQKLKKALAANINALSD